MRTGCPHTHTPTINFASTHTLNLHPPTHPQTHSVIRYRHKHQKSVNFSYGIEYDNPVADDDDDDNPTIIVRPLNGDGTTVTANIYVSHGDMKEEEGEVPKEIEGAAAANGKTAEIEEKASNSDRSIQSLILKFGEDDDNASQRSVEKEEHTSL